MQTLVARIDQLLADRSLLKHPFYVLWSEGKLTREALAGYSKEYYQLVKAVPDCVSTIAAHAPASMQQHLRANQAEEQEHVPLWASFSEAMGIAAAELENYAGLPQTQAAVQKMHSLCCSYAGGASAMYAFEKALPEISTTKLDGLKCFYGIDAKAATTYFEVHAVVDVVHAEYWAALLAEQSETEHEPLYMQAARVAGGTAPAAEQLPRGLLLTCIVAWGSAWCCSTTEVAKRQSQLEAISTSFGHCFGRFSCGAYYFLASG